VPRRRPSVEGDPADPARSEANGRVGPASRDLALSAEVGPFDLDANVSLRGIEIRMKRGEFTRDRDELDSLAAEAGQSAFLVGMTALMLVVALVLGFAV
jgi:hypothetical protein